ncbi:MAG: helix-turn-helix domain-containing protein [Mycobacterium sp.]
MAGVVKRDYRSDLRAAQALETRRTVVATAAELFTTHGYGTTTVDAIAAAAGVSRKTVFTAVGGKAELLKLALDWAVTGDDAPTPLAERPDVRELLGSDDPGDVLTRWAKVLTDIDGRVAALHEALSVAADTESEAKELLTQSDSERLAGSRQVVARVRTLGGLTPGLSVRDAADIAWLLTDPALYTRLVLRRNWSAARFERWLAATLRTQLASGAAAGS